MNRETLWFAKIKKNHPSSDSLQFPHFQSPSHPPNRISPTDPPSDLVSSSFTVDDHPKGYPQLSAFINSDENFLIARKYGYLRSRLLLYRQDELSVLEKKLIALDADDEVKRPKALESRKWDEQTDKDEVYSRKALMGRIDEKLKEYGTYTYFTL